MLARNYELSYRFPAATQLSRPLGADQLAYCLADGSLLLTEEANNPSTASSIKDKNSWVLLLPASHVLPQMVLNCFCHQADTLSQAFPRW